jgi:hypothetical protein
LSRAHQIVSSTKSRVFGRARAFLARATGRHKLTRTSLNRVPVLTTMRRTQAVDGGTANTPAKTQLHEKVTKSLISRRKYDPPHHDDGNGNGNLDLEWVDLNWDDFK